MLDNLINHLEYLKKDKWNWSFGSHHEWLYEIRVWRKNKNLTNQCHIFTGKCLEECIRKFNQKFNLE